MGSISASAHHDRARWRTTMMVLPSGVIPGLVLPPPTGDARRLSPIERQDQKMTRIPMIDPAATSGQLRVVLDGVAAKRGSVSHMMRVMANSPAMLGGYLGFGAALDNGVLPVALRERIAIAVAEANACGVCLAAHTDFGRNEGLSDIELSAARDAESADPATAAALRFALAVMRSVGHVSDAALDEVKAAGFDDAAIMEITAVVFINVLSNAVNNIAETVPDYPVVCAR